MMVKTWIRKFLKREGPEAFTDIEGWRAYYFDLILFLACILLPIALAATFTTYIREARWGTLFFEIGIFVFLGILFYIRNTIVRWGLFFFFLYATVITFFISLGPFYARPAWLVFCTVTAALLFGIPAALASVGFNAILLLILYFFIGPHLSSWANVYTEPDLKWIIFIVNTSFVSIVASLPVSLLLRKLRTSFHYEKELREKLSHERELLQKSNISLQKEIAERKQAEDLLRESDAKNKALLNAMPDLMFLFSRDGVFIDYYTPDPKFLIAPPEVFLGHRIVDALPKELAELTMVHLQEVFKCGKTLPYEYNVQVNNETRIYESRMVACGEDSALSIVRDITEHKLADEALRMSEERYRGILEDMEESYYEVDLEGKFTFFNSSITRTYGYTEDQITGMSYKDYMDKENKKKVFNAFHHVYVTGETIKGIDWKLRNKDGKEIAVEASVSLRRDPQGNPIGFKGITRDITERNRVEDALKKSEERYRVIAENARDVIWIFDLNLGYTFVTPSVKQLRGYTVEEALKQTMDQILTPESYQKVKAILDRELTLEVSGQRHGPEWSITSELEMNHKDGSTVWAEATMNIVYNENGEPIGIMGVTRDITERKQADKTIQDRQARLDSIFRVAPTGIGVVTNRILVEVNERICEMTGYSREELVGKSSRILYPTQKDYDYVGTEKYRQISDKGTGNVETRWLRNDGAIIDIILSSTPIDPLDLTAGVTFTALDITERKHAEEALRSSEKKYRELIQNIQAAVVVHGVDTRIQTCNRQAQELLGLTEEQILGKQAIDPDWHFFREDGTAMPLEEYPVMRVLATRKPFWNAVTGVHRSPKKEDVWVLVSAFPVSDENNELAQIVVTFVDITERKRAEEELIKQTTLFRGLFESSPEAIAIVDNEDRVIEINHSFGTLFEYSHFETKGRYINELLAPDPYLEDAQAVSNAVIGSGSIIEKEAIRCTKSKRPVLVSLIGCPIVLSDHQIGAFAIYRDITEHKRAEEALHESNMFLKETQHIARLGGWMANPHTDFLKWSEGVCDIIEAPKDYAPGLAEGLKYYPPEVIPVIQEKVANCLATGEPFLLEVEVITNSGKKIWTELRGLSPVIEGERSYVIGTFQDISDRKRSEDERKRLEGQLIHAQKMEALGTLAGGIAHDFNNLLTGILGNVSLTLMDMGEKSPYYERLKNVEEYVHRGSNLTKQLLGFARGGKYEIKTTDLGVFIHKSAEMFGRTKKEIHIHYKIQEDLWPVEVDRGQMDQVLLNLYINAWQAMPAGGNLYLSAENINLSLEDVALYGINPGKFAKMTVADTGTGMDEETQARIFEPFFTTKERGRGTGLGLASVYGIVKNHGGFIKVESQKDVGSSFFIYLPASGKSGVENDFTLTDEIQRGNENILVIDDEEMILDIGSKMLEGIGYKVITAIGGKQGLEYYEKNQGQIDLVILDMIMPDLSGKATFQALLRINPSVRVLLSSGYSIDGHAREILQSGCKGFIQKPFTMIELSKMIRGVLDE